MPLLDDPAHQNLIAYLSDIESSVGRPKAIVVISAHWEQEQPTLTTNPNPPMLYDYGGFPSETYELQYPAPGSPELAGKLADLLGNAGMTSVQESERGFDHGMFVPLMLMFPDASIPVVQLSLLASLNAAEHLAMGRAIAPIVADDVMILGSGFTFHNMSGFASDGSSPHDPENELFEEWLRNTCTSPSLSDDERKRLLTDWALAPGAKWSHPREEHLLPLHVCAGAGVGPATLTFDDRVLGKRTSGYSW